MPRTKLYYTLLVRDGDKFDGPWTIEFGSYYRPDVREELRDLYEGHKSVPINAMRIISTGDSQSEIQTRVDELNGKGL